MSRSNNTRLDDGESTVAKAKQRMDATRRAEKRAHALALRTGNPEHKRAYIRLAGLAQEAQDSYERATRRDTGWQLLKTSHGPRFHREIGSSLWLDVEPQVSTWLATATVERIVHTVKLGCRTQQEAAREIEAAAGVCGKPLPALEGGVR